MSLNSHYRAIGRAWDALAEANDATRGARLLDVAESLEDLADSGENRPHSDKLTAGVIRHIADADMAATGHLTRRIMTGTGINYLLGDVLDDMAALSSVEDRAALLETVCARISDAEAAEAIACMPYAPGMVGWRREERFPPSRTFSAGLKALGVAWRARRAG